MNEVLKAGCLNIFKEVSGLSNSSTHCGWGDERLLVEPLDALGVDSLALLEFVMAIENAYNIELDETDVNLCQTIGDFVALVSSACHGSN